MAFPGLADLTKHGADILFPRCCAACGKKNISTPEKRICSDCRSDITFLHQPVCRICGMELAGEETTSHLCGGCLRNPPPYLLARSVVRYGATVKKMLHGLKYGGDSSVLPGIAEVMSLFDLALFDQCDCVIPVPLHFKRLRRRGLNQSLLLAKVFFRENSRITLKTKWLIRTRNTVPQTTLDGVKRRRNLKGAFDLAKRADIGGRIICLVDDVFTTGTTVSECSRVLLGAGAKEVRVITLTRV